MINVCISYITPKVQKTEEKVQNKIDKSQNILDTYIFNPKNIESKYWRTFLVMARSDFIYIILLGFFIFFIVYFFIKKFLSDYLKIIGEKSAEILSYGFAVIVFLYIKIFIDKIYNFLRIINFLCLLFFTLCQIKVFWNGLAEKKYQEGHM
jgi:hypothetical protein